MSVINRMLLELDERHDTTVQERLPGMVRAVPARLPSTPNRTRALLLLLLLAVLFAALWFWWNSPWRMADSAKPSAHPLRPVPAVQPAPAAPETLQLQAAAALDTPPAPASADGVSPIIAAPTPIPTPPTAPPKPSIKPAKPDADAPNKSAPKILLKARDEAAEAESKAHPAADNSAGIKRVSKEQQTDFHYRQALSLVAQGRTQDAQAALEETLRLDPKHLAARQALLGIYLPDKRYTQAEQVLRDGLRLNHAVAPLATALAGVQLERDDPAAALATIEEYAPQAAGNAEFQGIHAALLQRLGRHAEAITQFQAALKMQPKRANWLMGLGISLQAEKRYAEAEQAFTRARAGNGLTPELQAFVDQRLQQVRQAR